MLALAVYFAAYFSTARFVNVGDGEHHYILSYRFGSVSLNRVWVLFEPARRVDELIIRRRHLGRTSMLRYPDGSVVE